jgi:hypothetical protein
VGIESEGTKTDGPEATGDRPTGIRKACLPNHTTVGSFGWQARERINEPGCTLCIVHSTSVRVWGSGMGEEVETGGCRHTASAIEIGRHIDIDIDMGWGFGADSALCAIHSTMGDKCAIGAVSSEDY